VIREQRSILLSMYKQYVRAGGPCSLAQFLDPADSAALRMPTFDFRFYEYDRLLRHYHKLFGRDSVLFLAFEQFVADPQAFASRILEFAGRPPGPEVLGALRFDVRKNAAESAPMISARRRINQFARRSELNPAPVFTSRRAKRLAKKAMQVAERAPVPRRMAERRESSMRRLVAEVVGDRYAASNRATAELTGIDLGGFGWMV
jgi:hypothetical protein